MFGQGCVVLENCNPGETGYSNMKGYVPTGERKRGIWCRICRKKGVIGCRMAFFFIGVNFQNNWSKCWVKLNLSEKFVIFC